ncbi:MAG: hypothetical protein JXA78_16265 [Anaerolineales bacterium]|nr:hypothetical protein [Anaerolineales bacterium]
MPSTRSPQLAIVSLQDVLVHEWYDEQRTFPLLERIQRSGIFRNPPIVTPMQDGSGRYVVLDGANRTAALRAMDCPDILVQVAEANDPGLRLRTWNHALLDLRPERLLAGLRALPGLDLVDSAQVMIELPARRGVGIALVQTVNECVYAIGATTETLAGRIAILNAIVNYYQHTARLDRTTFSEIHQVLSMYSNLCALVIFPKFSIQDLIDVVCCGALLPAGITRTTLSPRALHVNLPLEELIAVRSLAEKNARLQRLIAERQARGRIACYAGATFMFDE